MFLPMLVLLKLFSFDVFEWHLDVCNLLCLSSQCLSSYLFSFFVVFVQPASVVNCSLLCRPWLVHGDFLTARRKAKNRLLPYHRPPVGQLRY